MAPNLQTAIIQTRGDLVHSRIYMYASPDLSVFISTDVTADFSGPFYSHGLTLISAWISIHIDYKVWDEITMHPFKFGNG